MMNESTVTENVGATQARPPRWPYLVIAVVVTLVFGISVTYNFTHWDDIDLVVKNPAVIHPSYQGLVQTWTEPFFQIYMPMTYSLWIIEGIPSRFVPAIPGTETPSGFAPWIYHLGTFLLYFGCCFQAYRLIRRLVTDTWAALLGALFFAVHPLQAESASWISENKGLIATFFGLWAIGYYIDAVRAGFTRDGYRLYALSSVLYVLSLFGKPWAAAIPVMAAVIDFCFLRQPILSILKRVTPWILFAIGMILITQQVQPTADSITIPFTKRPYIASDAITFYLQKIVVPYPLVIDYGRNPIAILKNTSSPELMGAFGLAVVGIVLFLLAITRQWTLLGIVALFLAALLPNLGLMSFAFQRYSTVADRYGAPSLIAPALAWAFLAQWLRPPQLKALLAVPLAVFAVMSFVQTQVWRGNETLFAHTIKHNPTSSAGLINRSKTLIEKGDYEGALRDAKEAMTHSPDLLQAYMNYAQCNVALGRNDEALKAVNQVLAMKPDDIPALEFKVLILQSMHRYEEAIQPIIEWRKVVGENRSLKLRHARLLILAGKTDDGLKLFEEANEKKLSRAEREFVEAQVFEQASEFAEAIKRYRFIISHYPGNTDPAAMRLAWVLATATKSEDRNPEEAVRIIKRIVSRTTSPNAYQLDILAAAQASAANFAEAIVTATDAKLAAQQARNMELATAIQSRLELYEKQKPYIVPPPKLMMPNAGK
jgi:tetratricopeptide (TPR) repeat protein